MRIVLTGGGSGGHFYPIIAIAERLREIAVEKKVLDLKLYFLSPTEVDKNVLLQNNIEFVKISAGKSRLYSSIQNVIDIIKMPFAIIGCLFKLFSIYPDIIISKGGFGAFPVVFAARFLFIPVIMHESDTVPGRVNAWTGRFAKGIAVSYPEASKYFPLERVVHTGQPIRKSFFEINQDMSSIADLKLEDGVPTVLVLGGSLGSEKINENVLGVLPSLVSKYNVVHQTGNNNIDSSKMLAEYLLKDNPNKDRYKPMPFIEEKKLTALGKKADVIVSRAGSTIFEIALWGKPSIIIPITESNGDHQRQNAFSYARAGGCLVIEEKNLTAHILESQIDRLLLDKELYDSMKSSTASFVKPQAAHMIADRAIELALKHK